MTHCITFFGNEAKRPLELHGKEPRKEDPVVYRILMHKYYSGPPLITHTSKPRSEEGEGKGKPDRTNVAIPLKGKGAFRSSEVNEK